VQVEVWSDVICPWCWLGNVRLEKALAGFAHAGEVAVLFFDRVRTSNTFDAHQVLHLAQERGKQPELVKRLFQANFHDGIRIGDRKALVALAAEVGLPAPEVEGALDARRFAPAVQADQAEARALGASGVPFFVAGRAAAVSGAQSVEVLQRMLEAAWERRGEGQGNA
jgi:predicted DsbA family dithiol-disulfide isomerase